MRLPVNEYGHYLNIATDGVSADGTAYNWEKEPTEVTYTLFDGLDEAMEGIVGCATEQVGHSTWLYVLCDHRPTSAPQWQELDPVFLRPPFREVRDIPDINEYFGRKRITLDKE